MRNRYKLGIPLAAGLATGGYALSQGEDPGSAVLAGAAGGLGAYGGLQLAGRYAPHVASQARSMMGRVAPSSLTREELLSQPIKPGIAEFGTQGPLNPSINVPQEKGFVNPRAYAKLLAAGAVPAGALTAGLGGVALGAIPGAMGVPGFNQNVITDPELMASSNTPGARSSTPTLRYIS